MSSTAEQKCWGVGGRVDATLTMACPKCKAPKGVLCVYMNVTATPEELQRWPHMREQVNRSGKPTRAPHIERYTALNEALGRRSRVQAAQHSAERRARETAALTRRHREMHAVQVQLAVYDNQEEMKLYLWIKSNGRILFDFSCNTCNT